MWKALILIICFGCISLPTNASTHLQELMKEFPYGLLTDDYGILSTLDLKINACTAIPEPFPNSHNQAYSYWQCFTVKNSKMDCERGKYDPHEEALMSMLVLSGERNGELHEFISRRPIPLGSCKLYQKDWQKLTSGQTHVCVSGSSPSLETKNLKPVWNWIFDRYKTTKGCDSYFAHECTSTARCE